MKKRALARPTSVPSRVLVQKVFQSFRIKKFSKNTRGASAVTLLISNRSFSTTHLSSTFSLLLAYFLILSRICQGLSRRKHETRHTASKIRAMATVHIVQSMVAHLFLGCAPILFRYKFSEYLKQQPATVEL